MEDWRKNLDMLINTRLNEILKETKNFDYAISKSKDKSKAQIWIAIALLFDQIKKLETNKKTANKNLSDKEMNKILKIIEKL